MANAPFTPGERIRELSDLNAEVAEMMKQAGQAINALTNRPLAEDHEAGDEVMTNVQHNASTAGRQEAFKKHTTAFYTGVQGVTARLRRNVYGLEEAGIVTAETPSSQSEHSPPQPGKPGEVPRITNGGLGNLDVAMLNSKGNKVGAEKENELMQEAKELLESELGRQRDGQPT